MRDVAGVRLAADLSRSGQIFAAVDLSCDFEGRNFRVRAELS